MLKKNQKIVKKEKKEAGMLLSGQKKGKEVHKSKEHKAKKTKKGHKSQVHKGTRQ